MSGTALHKSTVRYVTDIRVARDYDDYFADNELFAYDAEVLEEWFDRPSRLIDLGCGTGRHLLQFSRAGFDVVGVDLSEHMLDQARTKLARADLPAKLLQVDFCDLPLARPDHKKTLQEKNFETCLPQ